MQNDSAIFFLHIFFSISALLVLSITILQAILLNLQNNLLKHNASNNILKFIPPLQTMEKLFFKAISVGFILLTISFFGGIIYFKDVISTLPKSKLIISSLSWTSLTILLLGHYKNGWRGQFTIRWTIISVCLLFIAYFVSKFLNV